MLMRFGTKILLLTLAITIGLSGLVIWVVTRRITDAEEARARTMVDRAINDYADRIDEHANRTRRISHLLLGASQVRSYLDQIETLARKKPQALTDAERASLEATLTQFGEEILGREMQHELSEQDVGPAAHVLVDRRGAVVVIATPATADPAVHAGLRTLPWPHQQVIEEGQYPRLYLVMGGKLYLFFPVPLQIELGETFDFAYFVGYEINDAWARQFLQGERWTDLRALVELNGTVVARSAPIDAAEEQVAQTVHRAPKTARIEPVDLYFRAPDSGERFIGAALVIPAAAGSAHFAFFSSLDQALAPLRKLRRDIALLAAGVVALAILVSQLMSRMIAKPVEKLVAGTERIARGEFNVPINLNRRDELGTLARSFNQMAAGLEQRDLIKDTFGKFVDPAIVQSMLDDPTRLRLGGERRVQTILFADLENFTAISEKLDPESLFRLLNTYLEDAADVVAEHRGIVDKFIGDGVVAFWGPPLEENHAVHACRAALALVQRAGQHDELCRELSVPSLRVRVGLATGEVLVGNIGSRSKYNYTVMGDGANLASRLEGVNKLFGTQILATARTAFEASPHIISRRIDIVRVIGRSEPVELLEILGESTAIESNGRVDAYHAALDLYRSGRWADARQAFDRIDDAPSRAMAGRCAVLMEHDPGPAWDGVWNLDRK